MKYKTPVKVRKWRTFKSVPAIAIAAFLVFSGTTLSIVHADSIQNQINQLNAQDAQKQAAVNDLQLQASSYQDAINQLNAQIGSIEAAIGANQAKQADLQNQIVVAQQNLDQQKKALGEDLKAMYVNGQMSTVEMLATSKSLNQFVDAETYRGAVQSKIQSTLAQIAKLQAQLKDQKAQVDQLLQTEQTQQSQLDSDRSQQNGLLAMNEGQQSAYNSQIKADQSQVAKLRAQQAAANASIARSAHVVGASGGSGGACDNGNGNGGYPMSWCAAVQDSFNDANGFPVRECTSYAYWYFTSVEGQTGFSVSGNAGWWWETSNYPAVTYDAGVKVGAIGVEPSSSLNAPVPSLHGGYYGHVMIVQALPGQNYPGYGTVPSGYVLVSSMNEDEAGHFMYNLWPANYLMYINPR